MRFGYFLVVRNAQRTTDLLGPYVEREEALDVLRHFCDRNCLHFASILRLRLVPCP